MRDDSKQSTFWDQLSAGQKYMLEWPMQKELAPVFPEIRVIKITQFAIKTMPAIAVISVLTQIVFNNSDGLVQGILIALFALSLPLQGLWWLGKRRETYLPPALVSWYREINDKIASEGGDVQPLKKKPRYKELALTLASAFKQLDRSSLKRWF